MGGEGRWTGRSPLRRGCREEFRTEPGGKLALGHWAREAAPAQDEGGTGLEREAGAPESGLLQRQECSEGDGKVSLRSAAEAKGGRLATVTVTMVTVESSHGWGCRGRGRTRGRQLQTPGKRRCEER